MNPSGEEQIRYARNMLIPGFGEAGQERLARARVAVVGLGALGCAASAYLAAAGVGTLRLIDPDEVDLSNLQRQILHGTDRIGRPKAESAAGSLRGLNPCVRFECVPDRFSRANAEALLGDVQVAVDGTDTFESKYEMNDACLDLGVPLATAGVLALSGQGLFVVPGQTACLRCVMPEIPRGAPSTDEQGILGAVAGVLGSLQALEAIRWIAGFWRQAPDGSGSMHVLDGEAMRWHTMQIARRPGCRCGRIEAGTSAQGVAGRGLSEKGI